MYGSNLTILLIAYDAASHSVVKTQKVVKTDEEWKKTLTPEQYDVARHQGTEHPFTWEYVNNHRKGIYKCAACGLDLFSSDDKFESGTGQSYFIRLSLKSMRLCQR